MALILVDRTTGKPLAVGDPVTNFRGERFVLAGSELPRHAGSTGRVHLAKSAAAARRGATESCYPGVINAEWREPDSNLPPLGVRPPTMGSTLATRVRVTVYDAETGTEHETRDVVFDVTNPRRPWYSAEANGESVRDTSLEGVLRLVADDIVRRYF